MCGKLEKEDPGEDGREGTAEDCGGLQPNGGGMHVNRHANFDLLTTSQCPFSMHQDVGM